MVIEIKKILRQRFTSIVVTWNFYHKNPGRTLKIIKSLPTFQKLSDSELEQLYPYCTLKTYKANEIVLKEGDRGEALYIFLKGKAEALKGELDTSYMETLGEINVGDVVGEMSFLESGNYTATVRTTEESEVLVFYISIFTNIVHEGNVASHVVEYLAQTVSSRIRKTDNAILSRLQETFLMTQVVVQLLILIAVYLVFFKLINIFGGEFYLYDLTMFGLFTVMLGSASYIVFSSDFPLSFYGVTLKNWFHNSVEGIVWMLPVLCIFITTKWVLIQNVPSLQGTELIDINLNQGVPVAVYLLLIPFQEFFVRGVLQTTFREFMKGKTKVIRAILTSNLILQMFHNVNSLSFSVFVFIVGIFWGLLFEKQKSLVGPIVSHLFGGFIVYYVLNARSWLNF